MVQETLHGVCVAIAKESMQTWDQQMQAYIGSLELEFPFL